MTLHMRGNTVHYQNKNNSSESETNTEWSMGLNHGDPENLGLNQDSEMDLGIKEIFFS